MPHMAAAYSCGGCRTVADRVHRSAQFTEAQAAWVLLAALLAALLCCGTYSDCLTNLKFPRAAYVCVIDCHLLERCHALSRQLCSLEAGGADLEELKATPTCSECRPAVGNHDIHLVPFEPINYRLDSTGKGVC
eukprot:4755443-Amphidinium_carterae.1